MPTLKEITQKIDDAIKFREAPVGSLERRAVVTAELLWNGILEELKCKEGDGAISRSAAHATGTRAIGEYLAFSAALGTYTTSVKVSVRGLVVELHIVLRADPVEHTAPPAHNWLLLLPGDNVFVGNPDSLSEVKTACIAFTNKIEERLLIAAKSQSQ